MSSVTPQPRACSDLAVIVPVSERHDDARKLYMEYRQAVAATTATFEFIYVLDGSFDALRRELIALRDDGEPIRLIDLPRGAGEATALMMGANATSAARLLILPAHYQVDPAGLPAFIAAFGRSDLLLGRRWPRSDSLLNRMATGAFSLILRHLTGQNFHDLGCGVRMLRRRVLEEITIYGDQHRFLPLLARQRGFTVEEFDIRQSDQDKRLRLYAPGIYFRRLLDLLAVFFLVKFTRKPLRFFGLIGTGLMAIGALVTAVVIVQRLLFEVPLADRPALLLGVLMVVIGLQLFALGLLGELIIFTHARELKDYTVAEQVNFEDEEDQQGPTSRLRNSRQ